ncbi:MAG: tRNA lysidine(34) synthetase TilS [Balneolaceae bacterium]
MSKFESSPLVQSVQQQLTNLSIDRTKSFVAGVSGGVDSMVMLYLLHRLGYPVMALHCNYQIRGEASDADQQMVEETAQFFGLECLSVRLELDKEATGNFQNAAREERYRIFEEIRIEIGAHYIATAHHRDDQVETILQKLLRGSGMPAWKGMKPLSGVICRPMLAVTKEQIERFAKEFHVPYRDDASNLETSYARNFLRHEWKPRLEEFFPGWEDNILRLRDRAEEFELLADAQLKAIRAGEGALHRKRLLELPEALRAPLLFRFAVQQASDFTPTKGLETALRALPALETGQSVQLSPRYALVRNRDQFEWAEQADPTVHIEWPEDEEAVSLPFGLEAARAEWDGELDPATLQFDSDAVSWPLTVESWQSGDRIQPLGMSGTKLVSDLLTDAKISSAQKKEALVIRSFDGTLCAVIFPHSDSQRRVGVVSERVRCTPATNEIIYIANKDTNR